MHVMVIGMLALAGLTVGMQPASAQISFSNQRYCTFAHSGDDSGEPDCSFRTLDQCRASAGGIGRYCGENPFWKPRPDEQRREPSRDRRG